MRREVRPDGARHAGGVTRSGLATMVRGPGLHRGLGATAGALDGTTRDGCGEGGAVERLSLVVHPETETATSSATTEPNR